MKCYKVEVRYYVYAESIDDAEETLMSAGITGNEYYSCHDIKEEDLDYELDEE